jgi:hypothetical protein
LLLFADLQLKPITLASFAFFELLACIGVGAHVGVVSVDTGALVALQLLALFFVSFLLLFLAL